MVSTDRDPESEPAPADAPVPEWPMAAGPIDVRSIALTILAVLALAYTMALASSLLLPLTVALLANLALSPLVRALRRLHVAAPIGAALVVAGVVAGTLLALQLLAEPAAEWVERAPQSPRQIDRKLRPVKEPLERVSDATKRVEEVTQVEDETNQVSLRPPSLARTLVTQATDAVTAGAVILVLLYFLLAESETLLLKIVELMPRLPDKKRVVELVRRTEADISRYLLTISLVNLGLGCVIALVTHLFGLPNPLLWGALAGVLNFVPYLGAMVSATIIAAVSLLTFDEIGRVALVPALCWGISALEGAFLTPTLLGRRLLLSPVVVFTSLFTLGWLWGIPGALVAVPVLVVLKIACDQSARLRPLGVLMGR